MKTRYPRAKAAVWVVFPQLAFAATTFYVAPPPLGADTNPGSEAQPFATIQKGVDVAAEGDTVVVAPATYLENVRFRGTNLCLRGGNPLDDRMVANTIIDGRQAGPVVTFAGTETAACGLAGFTIRNGSAQYGGGILGGAWNQHTHATIQHNLIVTNHAECGGALVFCDGLTEHNTIRGNRADHGGGLYQCGGPIRNNVISRNSAWIGGGLWECSGPIVNNTIVGNSADCEAGALGQCSGPIANCIVWGNRARLGAALYLSSEPTFSCIQDWPGGGQGNLGFNPCLVDAPNGDFHLQPWSPCIDAGDPASPFANEPEPNGERVDLGAYGNTPQATVKSPDTDADGLPDAWEEFWFGNLSTDATSDPDADLILNLVEYHYGGDPTVADTKRVVNLRQAIAYLTLQNALSASATGDELIAYPGSYEERIRFEGKNVMLRSSNPSDTNVVAQTVIDGGEGGPVVTFEGTEDETCVLAGFTIQNGYGSQGGGITGNGTRATIEHNAIVNNGSYPDGGGLYDCDGTVRNNTIADNWGPEDGAGGGLYGCDGLIEHNLIRGNQMYDGGGLYACHGTIQNNRIMDNFGQYGCGGLSFCNGLIQNNVIVGNSGWDAGGLAHCGGSLLNNTVADNYGLGIYACSGTIHNSILWGNRGTRGVQLGESSAPAYSCVENWSGAGQGNLASHPHFVDPTTQDYHLQSWSPCVDAGDPASPFANEPEPNGGRIDLGAYGNTAEATPKSADTDADGLPDDWERFWFGGLQTDGSADPDGDFFPNQAEYSFGRNPTSAAENGVLNLTRHVGYLGIQAALDQAVDGDELMVQPGRYDENIRFAGKNVVLRSSAPEDPDVVANTIIAGGETQTVVTFAGTENETCVLAGFAIMNGWATTGAGVLGGTADQRTRATIRHNTVTSNSARDGGGGLAFCDGLILSNTVSFNWAGAGGGLFGCGGTVRGNRITDNGAGRGGGLADCQATVQRNVIASNSAYEGYGGGLAGCTGLIHENTFATNSAVAGGGLHGCPGRIEGNVILANTARDGAGLADCTGAIVNNTVVGNAAQTNGGGFYACTGTIANCIIWDNTAWEGPALHSSTTPSYSCVQDWAGGGVGNHAFAPYFLDRANGNFHLLSWSPCIDAGDPASPFANEPEPNGGRIDQGAYGHTPEATSKSADTDGDDLPDDWEMHWFASLETTGNSDPDGDHLSNAVEYLHGRNPTSSTEPRVHNATKGTGHLAIQVALSAADPGDELVVYPGVYRENIRFDGKSVVLRSCTPTDTNIVANTILDGGQRGPVVSFAGTENEACVLSGFTIRNGLADQGGGICGGTSELHSRAAILNNTVTDCSATVWAGAGLAFCDGLIQDNTLTRNTGIAVFECDGTVQNNRIAEQRDLPAQDNSGCGLVQCDGRVLDNTIAANSGYGLRDCQGTIRGNTIRGNGGHSGGGLRACQGHIANNRIIGNSAQVGAGLYGCHGTIENNLIAGNSTQGGGAGLYWCCGTIQNNTIVANSSGSGGGGLAQCYAVIRNCIVWGNTALTNSQLSQCTPPSSSCIEGWAGGDEGNLTDPPQFVDAPGSDYHLQPTSPCIGRGENYYWFAWPQHDLDGHCRLTGQRIDLGCYEYGAPPDFDGDLMSDVDEVFATGTLPDDPDSDGDGLRDGLELLRGSDPCQPTAPRVVQILPDASALQAALSLAVPGDEVMVPPGTYRGNFQFCGTDVLLRGSAPDDPTTVAATILDGRAAGPVVSFAGTESETCVLAGFTIQNGRASFGAGLRGSATQATIRQNVITRNAALDNGGGLHGCHGLVSSNAITANVAQDDGGGLKTCHGVISHNTISANRAAEAGGGLHDCDGTIENNDITGNEGWEGGGGGSACDGVIRNNRIEGNTADDESAGGGLLWCNGSIQNNLILRNSAGYGGGLAVCQGALVNNTVYGNGAGGLAFCTNLIVNCIIWGNYSSYGPQLWDCAIPSHSCIQNWAGGGDANSAQDPQFVSVAASDYRLRPTSPGLDAGDNQAPSLPLTDLLGRPRILNGGRSLTVDLGPYELCGSTCAAGPGPSQVTLTWGSVAGKTYRILYSHDLLTWRAALEQVPSAGNLTTSWIDDGQRTGTPPDQVPCRFYRWLENP